MICVKENNLKRQFSKTKTKQMKTFKMFSQQVCFNFSVYH